jgi:hypothetical protein
MEEVGDDSISNSGSLSQGRGNKPSPNPRPFAVTVEDADEDMDKPLLFGATYGRCSTRFEWLKAAQVDRGEKPCGPFPDFDEWCLAEWMVHSGLSQKEIDKYLKLEMVSRQSHDNNSCTEYL